jgi:hypothetical protein
MGTNKQRFALLRRDFARIFVSGWEPTRSASHCCAGILPASSWVDGNQQTTLRIVAPGFCPHLREWMGTNTQRFTLFRRDFAHIFVSGWEPTRSASHCCAGILPAPLRMPNKITGLLLVCTE